MNTPVTPCFDLVDHHGASVTQADYQGCYLLVYFGFTHCKIVCPRSLAKLSAVIDRVGRQASRLTGLYITVDPERDTPAVMRAYLKERYPHFTGLTGPRAQIDETKRNFRVFAARQQTGGQDDADYDVPHTAIAYLIDPDGAYLAHFVDAVDEDVIVERIGAIIRGVATDA